MEHMINAKEKKRHIFAVEGIQLTWLRSALRDSSPLSYSMMSHFSPVGNVVSSRLIMPQYTGKETKMKCYDVNHVPWLSCSNRNQIKITWENI